MKVHNALTDDNGVKWEFTYEENMFVPVLDAAGEPTGETTERITNLRYRVVEPIPNPAIIPWRELPPWADIKEEWKINLGFFDEDDDGDICRYWEVSS